MKEKTSSINNLLLISLVCAGIVFLSAKFSFAEDKKEDSIQEQSQDESQKSFFDKQEEANKQELKTRYENFLSDYEQERIAQQRAGATVVAPAPTYPEWLSTQTTEKTQAKEYQKLQGKVESKETRKVYQKKSGR